MARRPLENPKAVGKPCPSCGTRNTQAQAWTEEGPYSCRSCRTTLVYWHQAKPAKWGWNLELGTREGMNPVERLLADASEMK